jgi:hypothetical protein
VYIVSIADLFSRLPPLTNSRQIRIDSPFFPKFRPTVVNYPTPARHPVADTAINAQVTYLPMAAGLNRCVRIAASNTGGIAA